MEQIIQLLKVLVAINSLKINDSKLFEPIFNLLEQNKFKVETFEENGVYNLYSEYIANKHSTEIDLAFVGHLDVVPVGAKESWKTDPFTLTQIDEYLYGRGTVDMKSSIATFIQASIDFVKENKNLNIAIIITGDEETNSLGAKALVSYLQGKNKKVKQFLIGEPTSETRFGDIIKNGRRGSANFDLIISGIQGHVAYPDKALNPMKLTSKIFQQLTNLKLDNGTEDFPPSNLEITSIDTGNTTRNIIPESVKIQFNIRYNTNYTSESLTELLNNLLQESTLEENSTANMKYNYKLNLFSHSDVFLSPKSSFSEMFADVIEKITGKHPSYSTGGGTSDGRILYKIAPILEFGPINETAHKVNERISLVELKGLYDVYNGVLKGMDVLQLR